MFLHDPPPPVAVGRAVRQSGDVGLDADQVMKLGSDPKWAELRIADTRAALARNVFGAPSYVIGDDIFWGQDRLEFVQRRLARG